MRAPQTREGDTGLKRGLRVAAERSQEFVAYGSDSVRVSDRGDSGTRGWCCPAGCRTPLYPLFPPIAHGNHPVLESFLGVCSGVRGLRGRQERLEESAPVGRNKARYCAECGRLQHPPLCQAGGGRRRIEWAGQAACFDAGDRHPSPFLPRRNLETSSASRATLLSAEGAPHLPVRKSAPTRHLYRHPDAC